MSVPGFDVRDYPGDSVMERLKAQGPYAWVGYYLASPNHPGASWMGTWRSALKAQGWGLAIVYVGLQHDHLDEAHGTAHGLDAATKAAGEGFAPNARLFLDVERHESVDDGLAAYVTAWLAAVSADGRFRPALYCHLHNALALEQVAAASGAPAIPFWVAGGSGFSLDKSPADSGYAPALAWQGWLDTADPSGTAAFKIDVSVASEANPSNA